MAAESDLESLYDTHAQALFGYLLNLTRHEQDTRDVLQEIFVKLARQPALLSGVRDQRAFLIRLAHNLAIDQIRRRHARDRYQHQFEPPSLFAENTAPDEEAFRTQLWAALGQLPAEQRAVIHLKLWENQTFEQIATTLNLSPNTAASRYRYGIDKLRDLLRPLYEEIK